MARPRDVRLWSLAVVALCILTAGGGLTGEAAARVPEGTAPPAAAALSPSVDVAVLPARLVDGVRSAASASPSRVTVLGAVLCSLVGLPALVRLMSPPAARSRRPVRNRRYAIALRAPPLPFAA